MDIRLKRIEVEKAYPSDKWERRVRLMSDDQVLAVYTRLKLQGKIR